MRKTSIGQEVIQEGSLREGLEAAIRERVREIIEMVLEEEVESTLGASCHPPEFLARSEVSHTIYL